MIKGGFHTLNQILKPFLNVRRICKFHSKPEYADYPKEEPQEIYMSSAYFAEHWCYEHFMSYVEKMCIKNDHFVCDLPYGLSLHHGLLSQKRVDAMMEDENLSEMDFMMEFEGIFYRSHDDAFFKSTDILPIRTIENVWYPPTPVEYLQEKDNRKKSWVLPKLAENEVRVLGVDIAMMKSTKHANDNSIFTFIRGIPKNEEYVKQVLHIEGIEGAKASSLALRIKQLFYDGECDYISMDSGGIGISVYDELTQYTYDKDRDITYPPMTCFNDEKMAERCGYQDAIPVIYSIKATAELNHDIAMTLKNNLQNKTIQLPVHEIEGKDYVITNKNFLKKDAEEQANLLATYLHTSSLQHELINLENQIHNGYIRLKEKPGKRKDRYSSCSYGVYLLKILEKNLKKPEKKKSFISLW